MPTDWPNDSYTPCGEGKLLRVHAPLETYVGVVDMLRNETVGILEWDEPVDGRARAILRTALEAPTELAFAPQ